MEGDLGGAFDNAGFDGFRAGASLHARREFRGELKSVLNIYSGAQVELFVGRGGIIYKNFLRIKCRSVERWCGVERESQEDEGKEASEAHRVTKSLK